MAGHAEGSGCSNGRNSVKGGSSRTSCNWQLAIHWKYQIFLVCSSCVLQLLFLVCWNVGAAMCPAEYPLPWYTATLMDCMYRYCSLPVFAVPHSGGTASSAGSDFVRRRAGGETWLIPPGRAPRPGRSRLGESATLYYRAAASEAPPTSSCVL